MALEILIWSVIIGLTSAGSAVALRKLSPVERLVEAGRKPWACDVCMAFWGTITVWIGTVAIVPSAETLVAVGPAYAIALMALRKLTEPIRPPSFRLPGPS